VVASSALQKKMLKINKCTLYTLKIHGCPYPMLQTVLTCVVMGLWTLSIVRRENIKNITKLKSQRFGSWPCSRPQVNGGGEF
jgi:hypothetical protein